MTGTKTFLLEIREAAMLDQDENRRAEMRKTADLIDAILPALARYPTHGKLATVNGLWARAVRLLDESEKFGAGPPATGGPGLREGARLAA